MSMSYGASIGPISRRLRPVPLIIVRSRCRVSTAPARLHGNDAGADFAVLCEQLADISVSISRVSLEIDLCHDGDHMILVEAATVTEQAQRILSHLAPRASPFYDQEQFVYHCREQPRLDRTEHGRTIDDHAVVTLTQLTNEARHLFAGKEHQRIDAATGHREVVEPGFRFVLDGQLARLVRQGQIEETPFGHIVELAHRRALTKIEIDQKHASSKHPEIGREAHRQRRFPLARNAGADQNHLTIARGPRRESQRRSRQPYRLGVCRKWLCHEISIGASSLRSPKQWHKTDTGNAKRIAGFLLAAQS